MTLLVTGATGFVMSVLGRHWLDADPAARLVVLDAAPLDAAALRYFAPVRDRLTVVAADVTRPQDWHAGLADCDVTHIVHGATITPLSRGTAAEAKREPEAENPGRIIDVNVMGTVAMLEWARTLPNLQRFIYVSSGAVYKHHGPDRPGEPLPEDGYVMPRRLYGISKLASELITERYGELFGLSTASVRPSSVYGTMDRRDGEPQLPARPEPNRSHGARRHPVRARQYSRCRGRLHPCGGCRARHRFPAACAAPALQYLQRRLRHDGDDRRLGRMGRGKSAGISRARSPPRTRRISCRIQPSRTACGAPTIFRASAPKPAGGRGRCARRCMPTWTGSPPNAGHRTRDRLQERIHECR